MSTDSSSESISDSSHANLSGLNFFELFALPKQFDIDLKLLKTRYRDLQSKWHPDRFNSASEPEKMAAVKMSSLLNDAFEVLSQDVKRASYLLALEGVDLQKDRAIDTEILLQQISLRERFEEITLLKSEQKKQQKQQAELLLLELKKLCSNAATEFSRESSDFSKQQTTEGPEAALRALKQVLSKMMFLNKLSRDVETFIEAFD